MNKPLRVSFNSPQSGWMSLSLGAGDESFVAAASYAPYDSLRVLIEGLTALLKGGESFVVKWNCEPDEFDFKVTARDDRVEFEVVHYTDHRRSLKASRIVFALRNSKLEFCTPFWRALRDLRRNIATDEYDRNWRRPFPQEEMRQLTEAVRSFKRQAKAG
ncbi:MAG: hypothetical protein H0W99_00120 [Acidobacteria bacterium]|nr:hypothetical protein [Acidobacteriota bacterium]